MFDDIYQRDPEAEEETEGEEEGMDDLRPVPEGEDDDFDGDDLAA